jgi:RND family efflux transporter MFP subunit
MNDVPKKQRGGFWKAVWKPVAGVVGLILFIAWAGGFFHPRLGSEAIPHEPGLPLPAEAAVHEVRVQPVAPRIDVVGTTESVEKIHLSARISAYVKQVLASAGESVTRGQVLVRLDDREIREQLAAVEARLKQAKTEYDRTKQLFDKAAATEQSLISAESAYRSAQAEAEGIKVMMTYTEITAPINGIVTDRQVEAGDLANPGQVLLTVYDPANMRMETPVPLRLIEKLRLGQAVQVELDRPAGTFQGTVSEIVGEIDPLSRTQKVKILLENPGRKILPGTFGRVWVEEDARPAILVPPSAVYRIGQMELVQLVKAERVVRRAVKTGARHNQQVEVLSGLEEGDRILVQPVQERAK